MRISIPFNTIHMESVCRPGRPHPPRCLHAMLPGPPASLSDRPSSRSLQPQLKGNRLKSNLDKRPVQSNPIPNQSGREDATAHKIYTTYQNSFQHDPVQFNSIQFSSVQPISVQLNSISLEARAEIFSHGRTKRRLTNLHAKQFTPNRGRPWCLRQRA